jgi:hypothetical protein
MPTPDNLQFALAFLIACFAKVTILLVCAWIIAKGLRRSSSAMRHHVWAAAILRLLALPFFALLAPAWHSTHSARAALWSPAPANQTAPVLTQLLPSS